MDGFLSLAKFLVFQYGLLKHMSRLGWILLISKPTWNASPSNVTLASLSIILRL